MTNKEQTDWLIANGFEEAWTAQTNMEFWNKILYQCDGERKFLQFSWYSRELADNTPGWSLDIIHTDDDIRLISDIPNDEDFTKFQPLIDLIK